MVSSFDFLNRLGVFNLNFLRLFSFLFQMNIFFVLKVLRIGIFIGSRGLLNVTEVRNDATHRD